MAINTASGFHVGSSDAIDSRLVLTKNEMITVNENVYPDVYMCVCKDDGLLYIFNKNNEIDSETGKFRVVTSEDSISEEMLNTVLKDYVKTKDLPDTTNFVEKEDGKGLFSGSYNDLTDKPTIPSTDGWVSTETLNTTLADYTKTSDLHTHDNKTVLDKFSTSDNGVLLFDGAQIEGSGNSGEVPDGVTYVNIAESEGIGEVDEIIDADRLGGRLPSYYLNINNYKDYLDINVEADFLTTDGHGKLRFYNGFFQYYNQDTGEWTDAAITPENVYIMNMTPQTMQSISATYDIKLGRIKLKFDEPADTVIDGQAACLVEKVVIRRKLGEAPENENDGELVTVVKRNQFGLYKSVYYVDDTFTPNVGEEWFYKAFPMSTTGFYNYSSINETSVLCKDWVVYGFRIDQTESDPASMITYIEENQNFSPAYMDYSTDAFNYGDWTVDNGAWFMDVKPCMLKYDGTVDYYLDPNDYTKKEDGTDSDVANTDFEGNAMVQFPKVYYKCVNITDDVAEYYFSDKKVDDDFHCWSHIDNNGNEIDYCYMPIYNGYYDGTRMRSISGQTIMPSQIPETYMVYAKANNQTDDVIWYTEMFADRQLVNLLLLLISKSTDTSVKFGYGNITTYVTNSNNGLQNPGTLNTKGLFWGSSGTTSGVKVFGAEHYWGNRWHFVAGHINDYGTQKVKLTYGQSDGSTVDGYNLTGDGYISLGCTPSGKSGGYISKMKFTEYGLVPVVASGSVTTYYTDAVWFNNERVNCALTGGASHSELLTGALFLNLSFAVDGNNWDSGASISCKPLATTT